MALLKGGPQGVTMSGTVKRRENGATLLGPGEFSMSKLHESLLCGLGITYPDSVMCFLLTLGSLLAKRLWITNGVFSFFQFF